MSLHIGSTAPDFEAETTEGRIKFHEWAGTSWVVFFSHPADYTPVCTTELGVVAKLKGDFDRRNAKTIALSVDAVDSHKGWIKDIEETQSVEFNYPIVADPDKSVSRAYDMVHDTCDPKITVRSVYFIDPNKKIRASITYPPSAGRNFDEILRMLDALQLTDSFPVATPANWKAGDDVVIVPSLKDPEVMKEKFPKGWKELRPYLRMTPQPEKK